jgi:hypothetical protein
LLRCISVFGAKDSQRCLAVVTAGIEAGAVANFGLRENEVEEGDED